MQKYRRACTFLFIVILLVIGVILVDKLFIKQQASDQAFDSQMHQDAGLNWFFLPRYCSDNNCFVGDEKTNEKRINFPEEAINNRFEEYEECTEENCITIVSTKKTKNLIDFYGYTTFEGYYIRGEDKGEPAGFSVSQQMCDKFVVQQGNITVLRYLQHYARFYQPENADITTLPVNIDLSLLSEAQKRFLFSSNSRNSVSIYVHKSYIPPAGIPPCFSFIKIVGIN